jgi:hypothetical protein
MGTITLDLQPDWAEPSKFFSETLSCSTARVFIIHTSLFASILWKGAVNAMATILIVFSTN